MRAARRRDTAIELALRAELDALGLSYAVDELVLTDVRRRADIALREVRIAVFVDGCFWHGCPLHGTWPKQNAEFWRAKIEGNRLRDADTDRRLTMTGWHVIRVWEHEDPPAAAQRIVLAVTERSNSGVLYTNQPDQEPTPDDAARPGSPG